MITAIVNTLNEELNIGACLDSLAWADEVIVVDMESSDGTQKIAKQKGARLFLHKPVGYVEPARNFALSKATNEWILIVDADERISPKLATKLQELSKAQDTADVVYLPEKNIVFGDWMTSGGLWPDYHPRFFKNGTVTWSNEVHATPAIKGTTQYLPAKEEYAIEHLSRSYLTVDGFISSYNRYSGYELTALKKSGYAFRRRHLFSSPVREFWYRYLKQKGYQQGVRGLGFALLFAQYRAWIILKFWEEAHSKRKSKTESLVTAVKNLLVGHE